MSQSLPMQPGIGYPADSQTDLLRKLVWNTWFLGGSGGLAPAWVPAPASAGAAGAAGAIAYDASYFYVCVATNTWRRVPLSSW